MSATHADPNSGARDTGSDAGWLNDVPAWGLSLLVHGLLALGLGSVSMVIVAESRLDLTSTVPAEEPLIPEYVIDTEITQVIGTNSPMKIPGASLAIAQTSGLESHPDQMRYIEEEISPALPMVATLPVPSEAELLEPVDLMGTTEHPGGTEGAIDRITWEIAASLRERKTIAVWLFDESLSLSKRRSVIADRFEAIYEQLGQLNVNVDENLTSGIVGFGADVHMLQGTPIRAGNELIETIRSIKSDQTGQEFVFTAVDRALRTFLKHKKEQRANLMFILVTDERGDDFGELEQIIRKCARSGTRVYCIGNSAVFGREKGFVRYTWESNGDRFVEDLPVDQGPETAMVESLQVPFWTGSPRNLARMSSGFGPYALTRLCAETGGIYFIADQTTGPRFDPSVMRQYAPDYRPQREYEKQLSSNRAKAALIEAAGSSIPEDSVSQPQRRFLATTDAVLKQQITEAQKPLARLDYYLKQLHQILERGESDRHRLDTDRWRASYDLAMGRVLAMRVRAFGYNSMLAQMKSNPRSFRQQGSNQWILTPSESSDAGARVKNLHNSAAEYLSRVIDEHPSTPWAWLARAELEQPLGWNWNEATVQVTPTRPGNNNNRPQFAPEDSQRRRQQRERDQRREDTRPKL
ncbi:MAG: VWA domain-containing protein [Fuerstiella sp.]|nr:VWA domain-containing protein [Fuerstiella sp.]